MEDFQHHFLTHVVCVPLIAEITHTDTKEYALITAHELFVSGRHMMDKLCVGPLNQLLVGQLTRVISQRKWVRLFQDALLVAGDERRPRHLGCLIWRRKLGNYGCFCNTLQRLFTLLSNNALLGNVTRSPEDSRTIVFTVPISSISPSMLSREI